MATRIIKKPKPSRGAKSKGSLVDFDRPPVHEVVFGVAFKPLQNMLSAHIGLWWAENKDRFPKLRSGPIIVGYTEEKGFFPNLGRNLFVSDNEATLIQIQQTRFHYNWVKSHENEAYPRYSSLAPTFYEEFGRFKDFISVNSIGEINVTEHSLSYVNYVPQGVGWNRIEDIGKILPDISWKKSKRRHYLAKPNEINFKYVFPLKRQSGQLTATIQQLLRKTDRLPVLRIELAASVTQLEKQSQADTPEAMRAWFDAAREAIVLGFLDLTSERLQVTVWGRRD